MYVMYFMQEFLNFSLSVHVQYVLCKWTKTLMINIISRKYVPSYYENNTITLITPPSFSNMEGKKFVVSFKDYDMKLVVWKK